jgi:xylulokinase
MAAYLLGVDIGTAGTKAALFDVDGNQLAMAYEESTLLYPQPGWVEQRPEDLYLSAVNSIKQVVRRSRVDPREVVALGFSGQMAGVMGIDDDWNPVTPYDSWLDTRCKAYVDHIRRDHMDLFMDITGTTPTIAHCPKILWWKNERPSVFARIKKFTVPSVYVAGKLAGLSGEEAFYDYTYVAHTGLFDVRRMVWSDELSSVMDISIDKLPRVVKPWDVVGELNEREAENCGLTKGVAIIAGAGDFAASCLGAGVTKPGLCVDVAGTASILAASTDEVVPDKDFRTLIYAKSVVPELWLPHAYVGGGGLCLRWFRDEFARYEKEAAERSGVDAYSLLDDVASSTPVASDGLFFIPHLGGRTHPYNPRVKGAWLGFSWKHKLGHFYRSILESIAYEYYYYLRIIKGIFKNLEFNEVRCLGGGGKSKIWNQIKADVLNMPYVRLNREEFAVLALAALGGYAVKCLGDYSDTVSHWVRPLERISPVSERHDLYDRRAKFYVELMRAIEPIFEKHEVLGF